MSHNSKFEAGVDPTKLSFFQFSDFCCLYSKRKKCLYYTTAKLSSKKRKNSSFPKKKSLVGSTPGCKWSKTSKSSVPCSNCKLGVMISFLSSDWFHNLVIYKPEIRSVTCLFAIEYSMILDSRWLGDLILLWGFTKECSKCPNSLLPFTKEIRLTRNQILLRKYISNILITSRISSFFRLY